MHYGFISYSLCMHCIIYVFIMYWLNIFYVLVMQSVVLIMHSLWIHLHSFRTHVVFTMYLCYVHFWFFACIMYSSCSQYVLIMYPFAYTIFHYVCILWYPLCIKVCIHCVFTVLSLSIHCLFIIYSFCFHDVFIVCSWCIHYVFIMYVSCIHHVVVMFS